MTKPGANDLFGSLKAYATRVLGDEINPEKSAAAMSGWLKESSDALRDKVEKEVERTVKRLGLAKQSEVSALRKEVAALRREISGKSEKVTAKKSAVKKTAAKKAAPKKSAKKVASKSSSKSSSKVGK
jgi:metal-dependent amidase/aminoacylase/carboxypeptidase family protein